MPQPNGQVAPPKTAEQTLRDEYDYAPAEPDVEILAPKAAAAPTAQPAGQVRDPATGQFVAAASPQQSSHPAGLLEQATRFGVANVEQLSTADLREAVRDAKLDHALSFRAAEERSAVHDALGRTVAPASPSGADVTSQQPGATPPPPVAPKKFEPTIDWGIAEDGVTKLQEKDWPVPAREAFKQAAMVPHLLERLDALERSHGETRQFVQGQASQQFASAVDRGFAEAGEQFAGVIGKGTGESMDVKSPAFECRIDVLNSLKRNPIKGLTTEKAIAQRTREKYAHLVGAAGSEPEPVQPTQAAGRAPIPVQHGRITEDQWKNGQTAQPTARQAPKAPPGPKAAYAAVEDYLTTHNMLGADDRDPEMPE